MEIEFARGIFLSQRLTEFNLIHTSKHSRFDCLMIAHFLAHSSCQWNSLTLSLDDVQIFHKVFNSLNSCHTAVQQVTIVVHSHNITTFHIGTTCLLDEIPQFVSVKVKIVLIDLSIPNTTFQAVKSNFKNLLTKTKAIKSIYMEILGSDKYMMITNFYDVLIEGIAHNNSIVSNLELQSLTVEDFEYLISLLIK